MKYRQLPWTAILTVFAISLLLTGMSYSSERKVSGKLQNGYRILSLDMNKGFQKFTVYRGDYIKFRLPRGSGNSIVIFPTLKKKKQITDDIEKTAFFKMKQAGIHPFQVNSLKGQVLVVEYRQASYQVLSSKEADAYIRAQNPLILDVRTKREYAMGHLENAILIPVQKLKKRINELETYKNKAILIYCASGNRSTVASKILIDSGYTNIVNMKRGIVDWAKNKYPIIR